MRLPRRLTFVDCSRAAARLADTAKSIEGGRPRGQLRVGVPGPTTRPPRPSTPYVEAGELEEAALFPAASSPDSGAASSTADFIKTIVSSTKCMPPLIASSTSPSTVFTFFFATFNSLVIFGKLCTEP